MHSILRIENLKALAISPRLLRANVTLSPYWYLSPVCPGLGLGFRLTLGNMNHNIRILTRVSPGMRYSIKCMLNK